MVAASLGEAIQRINDPLEFCKRAHKGQTRKYLGIPYYMHPLEVAELVKTVTTEKIISACHTPQQMYAASLLHDVVEDTPVTNDIISLVFGEKIADLVEQVTDVSTPQNGNRDQRKALDREHLRAACPCGKTIKLADLICNTQSIITFDPDFAKRYLGEKKLLVEILRDGDSWLFGVLKDIIEFSEEYMVGRKLFKEIINKFDLYEREVVENG